MFTGFASENTPAIQVWDLFQTFASTAAIRVFSLTDDCAPIQYFKTGATTTALRLFLPSAPIEGKQIKLINAKFGANNQQINIYSSDTSTNATGTLIYSLGAGQTLDLIYSKNFISFGTSTGAFASGWIPLNQSPSGASNNYAVVLGGVNNQANGGYSSVIGGQSNTISASACFIGGGSSNSTSSLNSFIGGGSSNAASNTYSSVLSGQSNVANSINSSVIGGAYGTTRSITGNIVYTASNDPLSAFTAGSAQSALLVLGVQTTDATSTVLRSDTNAASTTNQVILPNNSAYYVKGSVIANVTGGSNTKSWDFIATIKRGAGVGTTAIVGAVVLNVQAADAGASTWVVAITADTTNGGLAVTVTGQAATTIRWVAKLESTEVTY